jgi:hypothetical protein
LTSNDIFISDELKKVKRVGHAPIGECDKDRKPEETARVWCGYVWTEYQNGIEGTMCADLDGIKPDLEIFQ